MACRIDASVIASGKWTRYRALFPPCANTTENTWEDEDQFERVVHIEELDDHTAENRLGHSNGYGPNRAFEKWTVILPLSQKSMASVACYLYHIASP